MITSHILNRPLPWTEQDYLALGETIPRIELLDGGLLIGPPATVRHQAIVGELAAALTSGCRSADLDLLTMINLRLGELRIVNPDLVIATVSDIDALCLPAEEVLLVVEITAPHTVTVDRLLKHHYYAAAGIEWYLLVDQETLTVHRYQRQGGHYVERSVTKAGEALELTAPVRATIRPAELLS